MFILKVTALEDKSNCYGETWTLPAYDYNFSPYLNDPHYNYHKLYTNFTCTENSTTGNEDNIKMQIKFSFLNLVVGITPG
jgi:hypothetical protein